MDNLPEKIRRLIAQKVRFVALQYIFIDKDGKTHIAPFNVKKAEDYKAFYTHAAAGGFVANYHFRIDFYNDGDSYRRVHRHGGKGLPLTGYLG